MWQLSILADGIQILAALAGVLATDSVEIYAVDYSTGFNAPCLHSRSSDCWDTGGLCDVGWSGGWPERERARGEKRRGRR